MAVVYALAELSLKDFTASLPNYSWNPQNNVQISIRIQHEGAADPQWLKTSTVIWTIASILTQTISLDRITETVALAKMGHDVLYYVDIRFATAVTGPPHSEESEVGIPSTATQKRALVEAIVPDGLVIQGQWGVDPQQVIKRKTIALGMAGLMTTELAEQDASRKIFRAQYTIYGVWISIIDSRGNVGNIRLRMKNVVWIAVRLAEKYIRVGHTQTLKGEALWDGEKIATVEVQGNG